MRPLRIMHVVGNLQLGGAQKLTATIVKSLDRTEFDACVCCVGTAGYYAKQLQQLGHHVVVLGHSRDLSIRGLVGVVQAIEELRSLFIDHKIDIVHTHLFGSGLIGRIAAKLANVPVIVHTFHRISYGRPEALLENLLSGLIDCYVVDSNAVREMLLSYYGITSAKISVIHNGIDTSEFKNMPSRSEAIVNLGLPSDAKVVAIIAYMSAVKRQSLYVQGFPEIVIRHPNVRLLLVGDGPERKNLERQVSQLALDNHVHFLGNREDLSQILAATDILAHPSDWEGFGIILAEAMYCGIPIITTNAGGGAEVVSHLETGFLVEPGDVQGFIDATLTLIEDPILAARYGVAGRLRVNEYFHQQIMTTQYQDLYHTFSITNKLI